MSDYQQDGVFLCFLAWLNCISLVSQIYIREGLICLGLHYRSDGSSSYTSKLKYWVMYIWISLLLPPLGNFCHSADAGREIPGVVSTAGKSVFGFFLPKSRPTVCRTSIYYRGLLATALEQRFITDVFHSGRQDICLKKSSHDNTSKSSESLLEGVGMWHWQYQCEYNHININQNQSSWKNLPKPTPSSSRFPLSQLQSQRQELHFLQIFCYGTDLQVRLERRKKTEKLLQWAKGEGKI